MGATQRCSAPPRFLWLATSRTAELPEGFGIKPFSARTEARLCVLLDAEKPAALPTELSAVPTSTCAPHSLRPLLRDEIRHADCLSPAGYSTDDQDPGCYTGAPTLYAAALACEARTMPHYPLSLAIDDVGFAGCTAKCSFSWPAFPLRGTVLEPTYFRASLGRYSRRFPIESQETGPAWVDRIRRFGGMPWEHPFLAVADGYPAPGRKCHAGHDRGQCPACKKPICQKSFRQKRKSPGGRTPSGLFNPGRFAAPSLPETIIRNAQRMGSPPTGKPA